MKTWLATRADWIDSQWLAPPALGFDAGAATVMIGHSVGGTLYYTLDGSDPMESSAAEVYGEPFVLAGSALVRTRLFTGSEWSALNEATYRVGVPADATNLVVSEIHYHPAEPDEGADFIELQNISATTMIDLTGVAFTDGIAFAFATGSTLAPGERVVVGEADFRDGTRLDNGGERLVLSGALGGTIRDFEYDDRAPWPEAADGHGFSLVLIRPESNPDHGDPANWRRSAGTGGNPGTGDAVPYVPGTPLLAYALGDQSRHAVVAEGDSLVITLPRDAGAEDAEVTLERSDDLVRWLPVDDADFLSATEFEEILRVVGGGSGGYFRARATLR